MMWKMFFLFMLSVWNIVLQRKFMLSFLISVELFIFLVFFIMMILSSPTKMSELSSFLVFIFVFSACSASITLTFFLHSIRSKFTAVSWWSY